MKIGLTYNLKSDFAINENQPVDELEEYDCEETISALESAISKAGHEVVRLGGGRGFLQNILAKKVDFVFNIAEGRGGRSREAQIPAVLEMLEIPYVGSDPTSLALSQDKARLNILLSHAKVTTPFFRLIKSEADLDGIDLPYPLIVKPAYEGSSKGIRNNSVVYNCNNLKNQVKWLLESYRQPVLVEQYIKGEEITVGIVGNNPPKVVGVMQIAPARKDVEDFVYSLEVKRDWQNQVNYICPPQLTDLQIERIHDTALRAYQALDCRDFSRVDIRLSATDDKAYFIEINPLPGLNPSYSDLIIMTKKLGIDYNDLIVNILNSAMERYNAIEGRNFI